MIHLITGAPGNGKTLFALHYVEALAAEPLKEGKPSREVYYAGIKELKLPWVEMSNPEEWYSMPVGSIVVIDECQNYFRPRAYGKDVPRAVSEFEIHRHRGLDVVLITQAPMLLDVNIRRLAGRHLNVVRVFGTQRAIVHEWGEVKNEPLAPAARENSVKRNFAYPAASFGWYKSAEVHTHKRRIPKRIYFLMASPFIIGAIGWFAWQSLQSVIGPQVAKGKEGLVPGASRPVSWGPAHAVPSRVKTQAEAIAERIPLFPGFPQTAPIYSTVTNPRVAPYPAACVVSVSKVCRCYTQQGTRIPDMPLDVCRSIVADGYFIDWQEASSKPVGVASKEKVARVDSPMVVTDRTVRLEVVAAAGGGEGVGGRGKALPPSEFSHIRSGGLTPRPVK